jgi:tRNA wybutosine-synthesizing protein 3
MLPSFPALRERNLRTLYGDDYKEYIVNGSTVGGRTRKGGATSTNTMTFVDKSPKGSVDVRIQPLVNLINCHPDYVTLSSCSGRVALFDPGGNDSIAAGSGGDDDVDVTTDVADNDEDHDIKNNDEDIS